MKAHTNGNGHIQLIDPQVTIRALSASDTDALQALAGRDSARVPGGPVLGVERDGRLLAAVSTSSGEVIADPFHRTADLVALLRLRAGQVLPPLA